MTTARLLSISVRSVDYMVQSWKAQPSPHRLARPYPCFAGAPHRRPRKSLWGHRGYGRVVFRIPANTKASPLWLASLWSEEILLRVYPVCIPGSSEPLFIACNLLILVAISGLEPELFALRGRRVNQLHHIATTATRTAACDLISIPKKSASRRVDERDIRASCYSPSFLTSSL